MFIRCSTPVLPTLRSGIIFSSRSATPPSEREVSLLAAGSPAAAVFRSIQLSLNAGMLKYEVASSPFVNPVRCSCPLRATVGDDSLKFIYFYVDARRRVAARKTNALDDSREASQR